MRSTVVLDGEPAIRAVGLVKRFGAFAALDGLDLEVARGEVHGFLGPNGAGKSTTIRVLLGLLRANAGDVEVLVATHGERSCACIDVWPTCPATWSCGQACPVVRPSTCSATSAGARRGATRRADR